MNDKKLSEDELKKVSGGFEEDFRHKGKQIDNLNSLEAFRDYWLDSMDPNFLYFGKANFSTLGEQEGQTLLILSVEGVPYVLYASYCTMYEWID